MTSTSRNDAFFSPRVRLEDAVLGGGNFMVANPFGIATVTFRPGSDKIHYGNGLGCSLGGSYDRIILAGGCYHRGMKE